MHAAVGLRLLGGDDEASLQRVLEAAPAYALAVTGALPAPTDARDTLSDLPPGSARADKSVLGVEADGHLVGCIDLVRGYPNPSTVFLGLLILDEAHQSRGLGGATYAAAESLVREWGGFDRIRLAVVRTNDSVVGFWERMGFRATGEVKPYHAGTFTSECMLFEKQLHQ